MTVRNPTSFNVLSASRSEPRLPILAKELDDLLNEQQFAVDCQSLVAIYDGITTPLGLGTKDDLVILNCVGGKRTGDGSNQYSAYIVFYAVVGAAGTDVFWVSTRPTHSDPWTYSSRAMGAGPASGWYYFGSLISIPCNGDIGIWYEAPVGGGNTSDVAIFAIET